MQKKKIRIDNKKKRLLILSFLSFLTATGVTLAIIYGSSQFRNIFNASSFNVQLEEEFYNDWGTKKVKIVNNDNTPLIIRVSYKELWSSTGANEDELSCPIYNIEQEDNSLILLSNKVNNQDVVTKTWTSSWKNDFIQGSDGWYYYKKILNKNDSVNILNSITLNKSLIQNNACYRTYMDGDYELDFNYEAVQATEMAVQELWGHNITLNGGNITWNF